MKKGLRAIFILVILTGLMVPMAVPLSAAPITISLPNVTLDTMVFTPSWTLEENPIWDLTQGDLQLSYTIDLSELNYRTDTSPMKYDTVYVGLHSGDDSYGFMASSNPNINPGEPNHQHCLQTEMEWDLPVDTDESDYNVLAIQPNTIQDPPIGSNDSSGIWFALAENPYNIVITFHAIDATQGVMFATVNGIPQGFAHNYAQAGLSFTGNMTNMRVYARLYDRAHIVDSVYSKCDLSNITVTQFTGQFMGSQPQMSLGWLKGMKKGWDGQDSPPGWIKNGK